MGLARASGPYSKSSGGGSRRLGLTLCRLGMSLGSALLSELNHTALFAFHN
jgi:hypothetical protein